MMGLAHSLTTQRRGIFVLSAHLPLSRGVDPSVAHVSAPLSLALLGALDDFAQIIYTNLGVMDKILL